ncbi:MAG: hypothetical protein A2W25_03175 [candidate division Zixibacteria bacterium RBG_16_53_22]|nr:MAG: hypothetical protein A2W25_03175 [candidate division Zixibacteria bacterium RBG_16_53_22]
MSRVVCIGIPVYNGSAHLRQALDSLLAQSYADFHAVVLDDGSTDDSYTILERYSKQDPRITLFRNESRTGLIAAWNRVAELSGQLFSPDYFAWYSDHDWVEQNWLDNLHQALEDNPNTVLAHPRTTILSVDGNVIEGEGLALDTASMQPIDVLRAITLEFFGAGDAVYGLFRYEVLREIGFLPREILPDRLTVSEICMYGDVRHVLTARRYRRNLSPEGYSDVIIDRQLATLFASDNQRPQSPFLSHGTYFLRRFIASPEYGENLRGGIHRLIQALFYLQRQYNKYSAQWEQEFKEIQECNDLLAFNELLSIVIDRKWIPLTHDAESRLREFKYLCNALREGLAEAQQRLSVQTANREAAESRARELESACTDLRQGLAETQERLSAQTASREEAESRLREFKSLSNELRQGLAEAKERLSAQTAHREQAELRAVKLESQCSDLQRWVDLDASALANSQETNTQLSRQVESLTDRVEHPFRLLRQHLLGRLRRMRAS